MEVLHQELSVGAPSMQSPPPINDQIDQKGVRNGRVNNKINEKGVEDKRVESKNVKSMCKIDVKNDDDNDACSEEKVCRICQLSPDEGAVNVNLVLLGCGCKGELGISHYRCALQWFQQKGNRTCEICGMPAKNIAGIEDAGFRAYGTGIGVITAVEIAQMSSTPYDMPEHRWTKSLCNFLLAAILIAFLLPWALHPNKLL